LVVDALRRLHHLGIAGEMAMADLITSVVSPQAGLKILAPGKLVMKRASAVLGSVIFLVVAPGTVAVYVPWTICHWRFAPPLLGFFPFRIFGALMFATGLPVLLDSFARAPGAGDSVARRSAAAPRG